MTQDQIDKLLAGGRFPDKTLNQELVETHISWVIICDRFVYKIKKPVHYSFLDFSTIEMRKHFCEREIILNKRLTENIYLDVQPVRERNEDFIIGGSEGTIIDHAVRMRKLDSDGQMDKLLQQNKVTEQDIRNLAEKIAFFHKHTDIIYEKDFLDIKEKFSDLGTEKEFLSENLDAACGDIIGNALKVSDSFMYANKELLEERLRAGLFRDCHGDLHSRNIFLLPAPQPFDCLEFNDDFRQIDVLNEVAFLCMDLDAFDRKDLSDQFIEYYNRFFPVMKTGAEKKLFIYYKSYRANVRAKVNSLRAKSASYKKEKIKALSQADKYIKLMDGYIQLINR